MFDDDEDYDEGEMHYGHNDDEFDDDGDFYHDYDPAYSSGDYDSSNDGYERPDKKELVNVNIGWEATTTHTFKQMIEYLNEIRAEGKEPELTHKEIARLHDAFIGTPTLTLKDVDTPISTKSHMLYNDDESKEYFIAYYEFNETKWKDYGAVPNVELDYRLGETLEEHLAAIEKLDEKDQYIVIDTELETKAWQGDPSVLEDLAIDLRDRIDSNIYHVQDMLESYSFSRIRVQFSQFTPSSH